ncbi:LLM class flavin-dependent oxidoreductase [Clostridium botulinum]|uniref:LLM class flavin-dependent oxidoreductase n=1 Tax=Clostridium botulinum TaxID=1491 RepID=UPI001375DD42|nr:LLM class flavin-dependent oxidoreductase [Clostridium botulinum]NCI19865.1 LLM class flavin-dependent oxidoreductase [Clostridium botulinum]NCI35903.1 LLM class flavin-dependent oxidoreductase [Clostridium botulinum]NCI71760.1 LLM class flavin-dependent oxidoreductase [Clostridium botulinum]NDI38676.1 LLM class flavin-dependent oxidoreductase [Clostridium botulinum]
MSIKDDIKSYIVKSGWTLTQVQEELNKKNNTNYSVQNLSKKLNNETIKYKELLQIAEIIGYEIKWITK